MIVMVTNLFEGGKSKCEQYWPSKEEKEKEYGPFTIKLREEIVHPEYTLRTMEIKVLLILIHEYKQNKLRIKAFYSTVC